MLFYSALLQKGKQCCSWSTSLDKGALFLYKGGKKKQNIAAFP